VRACAYVRVSKEREGMISPEIQRDEINHYAERQGWTVSRWFEDLDLRGWQFEERPALQELLGEVRAARCGAVIVYRLDRFTREPRHYYQMIYEIESCGVQLHDASEGRYFPGPEMALLRGLKVLLAKNEMATLALRIKDSHKRLRSTGCFPGGRAPYGMRRLQPGPGLEPDPSEARWAVQIHEWFQRGWSSTRIARELNSLGVATRSGGKWLTSSVIRTLQRPTLAGGRLDSGILRTGGNITPAISEECWRRTQAMMRGASERFQAGKTSRGPLPTRLVRCGGCGRSLRVHYRKEGIISLRCWASNDGACARGVSIYAHVLEPIIQTRLLARLARTKAIPPSTENVDADLDLLDRELAAAQAALERLALGYAERAMELAEYQGARVKLLQRLERARSQREKQGSRIENSVLLEAIRSLWDDLGRLAAHPELLSQMPEQQRRDLYQVLIERIIVYPVGQKPRVEVRFRF
jgi:site-specific DNA recombinase